MMNTNRVMNINSSLRGGCIIERRPFPNLLIEPQLLGYSKVLHTIRKETVHIFTCMTLNLIGNAGVLVVAIGQLVRNLVTKVGRGIRCLSSLLRRFPTKL